MKQQNSTQQSAARTRIRKGDEVIVIAGSKRNLEEKRRVLEVYPRRGLVLVEGVNERKRAYRRGHPEFPDGGIHEKTLPIAISNVMLADPKTGEPTRIGVRTETNADGRTVRIRFAKKSGTDLKD